MKTIANVSRHVSRGVSRNTGSDGEPSKGSSKSDRVTSPGRYLVRSGSGYLFQMRLPDDLAGVGRIVRIGLGPLTAKEARATGEMLAALARNKFEQMRIERVHSDNDDDPAVDGDTLELAVAEVKGYLKAMLHIVSRPPEPTPPHLQPAHAGLKNLVLLNRELSKGADANPLIANNVELLKSQAADKINETLGILDGGGFPPPVQPSATTALTPVVGKVAGEQPVQVVSPVLQSAPQAAASTRPEPKIHRDQNGKIIPGFRLDRRYVARKPSSLPRLSEVAEEYFAAREVKVGEKNKDIGTARYRIGLFIELIGDHPVDTYTGADLQAYIALMTHWPAQKRDRREGAKPLEILAANADLVFKPLKRSAFEDGYVSIAKTIIRLKITEWEYPDPFAGVRLQYPDTAAPRESAEPLSFDQLSRIFREGVKGGLLDEAMLPLLGELTGRRLGLLVHLTGNDLREKYPGVWVAQTGGIVLAEDGKWRRVPIKTDASTTFFVLHDFFRRIGFIEWAVSQGDAFLFPQLTKLADPSKSASSYMGRLFRRAGIEGNRKEVFHSLRGSSIENMRDNKVDPRDRKLQAGHQLEEEHDLYGFRAISETRARVLAHSMLSEEVDFSVFEELDFDKLRQGFRNRGRRRRS